MIALTSVAANCASVAGGVLVFGDPVGNDPLAIVARCVAFAAVIAAASSCPLRARPPPLGLKPSPRSLSA